MKKTYISPVICAMTVAKEDILSASENLSFIDQQDNTTPDDFELRVV